MLEMLIDFWFFITDRDRSKWYTFTILDMMLIATTGLNFWVSNYTDSCIGWWVWIIIVNSIQTHFHNLNNHDEDEDVE